MQKNKTRRNLLFILSVVTVVVSWMACNKGYDRVLGKKDYTDTTSAVAKNPKVLYIIVDGARGQSVRDANPPNIMGLTSDAIYCWNTVTDTSIGGLTNWADLLTGVHKEKHKVIGGDVANSDLADYPIIFKYIRERNPNFRIAAFCSSDSLSKGLITDATVNKSYGGDDAAVQAGAISELGIDSTGLVMVEYGEVDAAGKKYGYDNSFPEYKSAILNVDGYIGKLLDALKKRKNFAGENWMVVVTSNHGGAFTIDPGQDDHTILSDPRINSFVIFSTPIYLASFIDKPYTGNRYSGKAVELHGADSLAINATVPDDLNDYDFADSVDFTIEFKIKTTANGNGYSYQYPSILSKRASFDPGVPGWCIFLEDQHWQINFGQVGKGNIQVSGNDISDGNWHDIAVVVYISGAQRLVRTFTDGNFNNSGDITSMGNLNTPAPLTMGFLPGSITNPADVYMTEVRIWNAALADATISQFACETSLPDDHPNKNNLIGYWPAVDGQGGVIKDQSTLQHDFILSGAYSWNAFNDLICAPAGSDLASQMPQPVDVPTQILSWLQIPTFSQWGLDGRVWTTNYTGIQN